MKAFFRNRSKILFVCAVLSVLYSIYLFTYFSNAFANADSTVEEIGSAIAIALVMPHMIMMGIGAIFACLGVFLKAPWGACVAGILFSVGTFLFISYAMFSIPLLILAFIGFAKQKKINQTIS